MFKPKYRITSGILNNLTKIAEIRAIVSRGRLLPVRESFLRRAALIKMAHTSTSIEGNTLNEYQVKKVLGGGRPQAEESQIKEVKNYLRALKLVDKIACEKNYFGEKEILTLHKTVVSDLVEPRNVGIFRQAPVYVVNVLASGKEQLVYAPPGAEKVAFFIKELLSWLRENKNIHPLIRAGLFHYQFETIHPFTDGNGRTGRLLTLLYLYQSGWDFRHCLVLEDYYNRDRKKYYLSLQTGKSYLARREADLTGWLEYFVAGFLDEAKKVKERVLMLEAVGKNKLSRQVLNEDELEIIDFVISLGKITSADVVDILRIPKRTAQAKLKRLEESELLIKKGRGPATAYFLKK